MPSTGKFSCDSCGKSYSWKPELAGKKVKCKCGSPLRVPENDPAADSIPDGFDDLAALGEGIVVEQDSYAAAPVAGKSCPSCGSAVDEAAVLCVNCGHNLKTGKKLKTSAGRAGVAAVSGAVPEYRSYSVKSTEEPISPEKKKMIMFSISAALILIVATVIIVNAIGTSREKERQRLANLNAPKPFLETVIERSEKSGGLVESMTEGRHKAMEFKANTQLEIARLEERVNNRFVELSKSKGPLAKTWLDSSSKTRILGFDHAKSIAFIKEMEGMSLTDIYCIAPPKAGPKDDIVTEGLFATLPGGEKERNKVFDWDVPKMKHVPEYKQYEIGQNYFWIEFTD